MGDSVSREERLRLLAGEVAEQVAGKYRIGQEEARAIIMEAWSKDRRLLELTARTASLDRVKRTRVFREAADAATKMIYYQLRRYRQREDSFGRVVSELLRLPRSASSARLAEVLGPAIAGHVSTAERAGHLDEFLGRLLAAIGNQTSVLDVGCGALPLLFPFDGPGSGVRCYCAADRDEKVVDVVDAYARWRGDGRLVARHWELSEGWEPLLRVADCESFDVALLLKLVPAVQRQQPTLLDILAAVPAQFLLVTGSRGSMVKRGLIERRELAVIRRFAERHSFEQLRTFRTQDEAGYLFRKSAT